MKLQLKKLASSRLLRLVVSLLALALLVGVAARFAHCGRRSQMLSPRGNGSFTMGFGDAEIALPETDAPLYMAGYHQGWEIEGVLDLQRVSAVWMESGHGGVLLLGVDAIGLGSDTVADIREALGGFCRETGCLTVMVYATHTHAGVDTLGLWGPLAMDGKNAAFMENLIDAAVSAARTAYADRAAGALYYGEAEPQGLLEDSRDPQVFDPTLYQIRFDPTDTAQNGIRLLSYAAHAESLRGDNRLVSRDYPGAVADRIRAATGDDTLFLPSAIGGLIMTRPLVEPFDAVENLNRTADVLAAAALGIVEERPLSPLLGFASDTVMLPLDNTVFFYYRFLGILGNPVQEVGLGKYALETEIGLITIGDVTLALVPGEIFPELVSGDGLSAADPPSLRALAEMNGIERLIVVGLANDELGYILPESDFLLHADAPYLEEAVDETGDGHYEETNSLGPQTARLLLEAFEVLLARYTER